MRFLQIWIGMLGQGIVVQNKTCLMLLKRKMFCNYFETDRYISFVVMQSGVFRNFVYDKNNGEVKWWGASEHDLIITVKSDRSHRPIESLLKPMQSDTKGLLYSVWTSDIDKLRTAACEGMLVENLDRLEEIKQLTEDSNPVIFYMKFKEPMK